MEYRLNLLFPDKRVDPAAWMIRVGFKFLPINFNFAGWKEGGDPYCALGMGNGILTWEGREGKVPAEIEQNDRYSACERQIRGEFRALCNVGDGAMVEPMRTRSRRKDDHRPVETDSDAKLR